MDIADYVNAAPPTSSLGPLTGYLRAESHASAVDLFQKSVHEILTFGTVARLTADPFVGRLLIVGLVSAVEGYVRSILADCLGLCPMARAVASKKSIGLGGILWHGQENYARSAFETQSFAGKDELSKGFKDYIGFALDEAIFKTSLDQFETICHLRHGIAHGDGLLPGRNAVLLDIPRYATPVRIVVGYAQLQETAAVVSTLVVTLNRQLFVDMCKRWAIDWRKRSDWDPASEEKRFGHVWRTFSSLTETSTRKGKSKITRGRCMGEVKALYSL